MASSADIKLAYLSIMTPVPNVYIGGVMVTDMRGLPVEFRYSEPIQPTKIQQILYGQVLSNYIKEEVIVDTLVKGVSAKFNALLVQDESLLAYPLKNAPILRISETNSPILDGLGSIEVIADDEILIQTSSQNPPIRVHYRPGATVSPPDGGAAASAKPYQVLVDAGQYMDIYEPMKRIAKALELICQETGITE